MSSTPNGGCGIVYGVIKWSESQPGGARSKGSEGLRHGSSLSLSGRVPPFPSGRKEAVEYKS